MFEVYFCFFFIFATSTYVDAVHVFLAFDADFIFFVTVFFTTLFGYKHFYALYYKSFPLTVRFSDQFLLYLSFSI